MKFRIKKHYLGLANVFLLLGALALLSTLFANSPLVDGQIGINDSALTKVNVTNAEPHIINVVVTPNPVDLTASNTTEVLCNATTYDFDGWDDINQTNATIFRTDISPGAADDNNNHYSNSSCATCLQLTATNASCSCLFDVQYYTDNTSWTCNISILDTGNLNVSNTTEFLVNELVAIEIPPEIDFGNLAVTETSGEIEENVTNQGNANINLTLFGYGGTDITILPAESNVSMLCSLGNISRENERYSITTGTAYNNMNIINATPFDIDLNLSQRTNDLQRNLSEDVNTTFWRLRVPLDVGGVCNGTIVFEAQAMP